MIGPFLYILLISICFVLGILFILFGLLSSKISKNDKFYLLTVGTVTLFAGTLFSFYKYINPLGTSLGFLVVVLIAVMRKVKGS